MLLATEQHIVSTRTAVVQFPLNFESSATYDVGSSGQTTGYNCVITVNVCH